MKLLELRGKRWFDSKNGNTYFSAVAYLEDEVSKPRQIAHIVCQYGYGDQWEYEICKAVSALGLLPVVFGEKDVPWRWYEALKAQKVFVSTHVVDVKRKGDLSL